MNVSPVPTVTHDAASRDRKRALIADDHRINCEAIAYALETHLGFDVEWAFGLEQLEEEISTEERDLVLLDTHLPDPIGIASVKQIATKAHGAPLLLLIEQVRKEFVTEAISAGAAGVLEKSAPLDVFANVVKIILAGGEYVPAQIMMERDGVVNEEFKITREEQILLESASNGYSDKEIALETTFTISHVKNVFLKARAKLGARNRAHAVMIARKHGII